MDTLLEHLTRGEMTSAALQAALGVSQSTVSRLIEEAGDRVLRLGRGRSTRYLATRRLFGEEFVQPLYCIDEEGHARETALLRTGANGRWYVEAHSSEPWLLGNDQNGEYDGLPYFLEDLRPSGFLGREIARRLSGELGLPAQPGEWNAEQLGGFLLETGEIMPGNLLVGRGSAARAGRMLEQVVADPEAEYPILAALAVSGDPAGSSVAGEQPKFTAWREETGHVIVKFSPADDNAVAERWRDLLIAEHHAQTVLRENDLPAAETRLLQSEGRVFLESRRFDRMGRRGRIPALSLEVVDAEFTGAGGSWRRSAEALHARGLLEAEDVRRIAALQLFGEYIGNTDMHFGNLGLTTIYSGFRLLPIYDMLPMMLAPRQGEVPPLRMPSPRIPDDYPADIASIRAIALAFRERVAEDARCSPGFRQYYRRSG
jgi:hypothetical protein